MWDRHRCHDNIISLLSKASSATPSSASCCVRLSHARQPTHLPLLFATVHLLAFQKCFYDLSQSIKYLNSGRGWGQVSLPSSTARPACPSQLRVCRLLDRSSSPQLMMDESRTSGVSMQMWCCSNSYPVCDTYLIGWFALKCLCIRHHQIWRKNVRLFKDTNRTTLAIYSEFNQLLYRTSTYRVHLSTTNTEIANT